MIREIRTHKVNGLNEALQIEVLDEPGQGNACHFYRIAVANGTQVSRGVCCDIEFQNGPIAEAGINGISNESLLAVVRDRLEGFQNGPYACETNAQALERVVLAMEALHFRTKERLERGVEGTHVV